MAPFSLSIKRHFRALRFLGAAGRVWRQFRGSENPRHAVFFPAFGCGQAPAIKRNRKVREKRHFGFPAAHSGTFPHAFPPPSVPYSVTTMEWFRYKHGYCNLQVASQTQTGTAAASIIGNLISKGSTKRYVDSGRG
jgi:hypothetical protein